MTSSNRKKLFGRKTTIVALLLVLGSALAIWLYERPKDHKLIVQNETSIGAENEEEGENEKEDGIRAAQEQEFETTKDISLGYIPKNRLIRADEALKNARMNGTYTQRVDALTWTERGSNSDAVGPSNGNGRPGAPTPVTSGRIRAIWVDLSSTTTVWVGGIDGGLWKTTNIAANPATWVPINDFFGNLAVSSICQSPANNNVMYFGTGEKAFAIDAVQGGGVWKSTDHGATWALLPSTTGFWNVSKVLCDPTNVNIVYVATIGSGAGIQRSIDGGSTWTTITPSGLSTRIPEMQISSTGRMHITCGYYNTVLASSGYRYTDNPSTVTSATWTSATTSFTPTQYNVGLAVAGNTLYALPSDVSFQTPQVWKSTDGGDHWATTGTTPTTAGSAALSSGQAWYNLSVIVDPVTPNNVMVGGLNSYRSTDGGATWTINSVWVTGVPGSSNYIHADHHFGTWNGTQVLEASDGGLFYSNDGGVTFTDRNVGLRLKQFYSCAIHPTSTNYFLAGAQDNGCHQFNGAGLTSSVEVTGGDGAFVHIDQDEPQYQFGAYVFAQYRRSTDGGSTWASVNFSASNSYQFINPTDYDDVGNIMYTGGLSNQYVRWDNPQTGSTFTPIAVAALNGQASSMIVSPYTPNRVFFGSTTGSIVRVDNANTASPTATNITQAGMSAATVSCVAVGTNDNNLLATFSNYGAQHVWVTTNGSTWTNISGSGLPDIPVRWAMFYPEDNTKAILATEMGIYETNLINGASTVWAQNSSFPVVRTDMLQYRKSDGLVLAASHGRGLWSASIPLSPYIRFAASASSKTEATASSTSCRNYTDYTVNMNIDAAPTGTATVTLSIAGGATATQGIDFDFTTNGNFAAPSNTLTFASGSTTPQPITVRVYNDAEIESAESFTFNYVVSGATNALGAPSSPSHTFIINDNDVAPVAGGGSPVTATIGTNGVSLSHPFRAEFTDARTQMIYLASELTAAGFPAGTVNSIALNVVSKVSTAAFDGFTIKMKNTPTTTLAGGGAAFEGGASAVFGPVSYSTVSGINTFNLSSSFVWDGTSNILVDICFDNVAAVGISPDLVAGVTPSNAEQHDRQNGTAGCSLPSGNFVFNGGGAKPVMTFTITPAGNPIETTLNNNRTEYVGNNGTYYFYNGSNIISSLAGSTASLGCVASNIFNAGNTWQSFLGGFRSQKVFDIAPTTNPGATYTVGLYFTAAELSTYSSTPASLRIAKTTAATMAAANAGNTVIASSTSFAAYGSGYVFTAAFTGFSKFFLIDGNVTLPITLLTFDGHLDKKTIPLNWSTSQELSSSHFEIEKSTDGNNFHYLGKVMAAGTSISQKDYGYVDVKVNEYNYYRLKMVDIDGKFVYSKTILIRSPDVTQDLWVVNNPFGSYIDVRLAKMPKQSVKLELLSMTGARMYYKELGATDQVRLDLSAIQLGRATYILKATVDGKQYINKVLKQ